MAWKRCKCGRVAGRPSGQCTDCHMRDEVRSRGYELIPEDERVCDVVTLILGYQPGQLIPVRNHEGVELWTLDMVCAWKCSLERWRDIRFAATIAQGLGDMGTIAEHVEAAKLRAEFEVSQAWTRRPSGNGWRF